MKKIILSLILTSLFLLPVTAFAEDPLPAPKKTTAVIVTHNKEGINHYKEGHWDVAIKHFRAVLDVDETFAVGHFNLALALDMAGMHGEAADHFKKAAKHGPNNKDIQNSKMLRAHIGHDHDH